MNIDLGKTKITDNIRVSSAAIYYDNPFFGDYYQLETWVFSDDQRIRSFQVIHGTCSKEIPDYMIKETKKVHRYISNNMFNKFKINN